MGLKDKINGALRNEEPSKYNSRRWVGLMGKSKTGAVGTNYTNFSEAYAFQKRKHYNWFTLIHYISKFYLFCDWWKNDYGRLLNEYHKYLIERKVIKQNFTSVFISYQKIIIGETCLDANSRKWDKTINHQMSQQGFGQDRSFTEYLIVQPWRYQTQRHIN